MVEQKAVICEDLVKRFGGVTALDRLTFSVEPGEMFGLVGPDGAGKTTTMRILCGLMPPDEGRVMVLGRDVARAPESIKPDLGYVAQQFSLYADLTVVENIRFFADLYSVPRTDMTQREEQLLAMTRMAPFRRRLAGDLSGGMKQKLGLMCNLIHRPRILFLDEPTTGVDPISRRDFFRLLYDLHVEGVTILLCTPYMDEAERAGRLAFVQAGQVIAMDTPDGFKGRLPGPVAEFEVEPQREAVRFLADRPEVTNPFMMGERVRATLTSHQVTVEAIRADMESAGFRIRHARLSPPRLEDAFVYLIGAAPQERVDHA